MKKILNTINLIAIATYCNAQVTFSSTIQTHIFHSDGISSGDVNNDGKIDLIASKLDSSCVSVFLGNGSGNFNSFTNYPTDSNVRKLILVDINNDSKLDILTVSNNHIGSISVLLGNGSGAFGSPTIFTDSLTGAISLCSGDFDGDSKIDIAVANSGWMSNNFTVYKGNGLGSFILPTVFNLPLPIGYTPLGACRILTTDFNNDGKLDLVITYQYQNASFTTFNQVVTYTGNGIGSFTISNNYNLAQLSTVGNLDIKVCNFDNDNDSDIVALTDFKIYLLKNNGIGTFTLDSIDISASSVTNAQSILVNDFNNDGNDDLIISGTGLHSAFMQGNGNGTFLTFVDFLSGNVVSDMTTGDFNNDGKFDFAFSNFQYTSGVGICLNTSPTSIKVLTTNSKQFLIFPTISERNFTLECNQNTKKVSLELYDIGGKKLQSHIVSEKYFNFELPYSYGIYFVKIYEDKKLLYFTKIIRK
jgi:hypothetical protein